MNIFSIMTRFLAMQIKLNLMAYNSKIKSLCTLHVRLKKKKKKAWETGGKTF